MPATQKDAMPEAYCCKTWDHRVAFFVSCVIGFAIVCGFVLLFGRAM